MRGTWRACCARSPDSVYEISDRRAAYLAEIVEAQPARVTFRVLEPVESKALPLRVTLCAALIKFDRFEWIVEKATELGVERIVPVEAARSEKGLFEASRKRAGRWDRVARESSQQSRRLQAPEILPGGTLCRKPRRSRGVALFPGRSRGPAPVADAAGNRARRTQPRPCSSDQKAAGRTPNGERAAAAGWQPVSLSTQVLRAETAAAAAVAILVNAWMQ